jgi:hypothetical protein
MMTVTLTLIGVDDMHTLKDGIYTTLTPSVI